MPCVWSGGRRLRRAEGVDKAGRVVNGFVARVFCIGCSWCWLVLVLLFERSPRRVNLLLVLLRCCTWCCSRQDHVALRLRLLPKNVDRCDKVRLREADSKPLVICKRGRPSCALITVDRIRWAVLFRLAARGGRDRGRILRGGQVDLACIAHARIARLGDGSRGRWRRARRRMWVWRSGWRRWRRRYWRRWRRRRWCRRRARRRDAGRWHTAKDAEDFIEVLLLLGIVGRLFIIIVADVRIVALLLVVLVDKIGLVGV